MFTGRAKSGDIRRARSSAAHCDAATSAFRGFSGCSQLVSMAAFIPARSAEPPPVADYDAWFASNMGKHAHSDFSGRKLRRAVQMVRNGCNHREIADALGTSTNAVGAWLRKLPPELRA